MENKENAMQPEPELTEEAQLDLLLEQFLAEEPESEITEDALVAEAPLTQEDLPAVEEAIPSEEEASVPESESMPVQEALTQITEEPSPVEPENLISDEEAFVIEEQALISEEEMFAVLDDLLKEEEDVGTEEIPIEEETITEQLTQDAIWEDQPVDIPVITEEIGPDEIIVAAAGLTHPGDVEFEKIMEEALLEVAAEEAEAEAEVEEDDFSVPDEFFLPVEKNQTEEDIPEKEPYYTEVDLTGVILQQQQELAQMQQEQTDSDTMAEEEEEMEEQEPVRKRRPKNTGTYGFFGVPHMITTVIWLALILFIGAGLGRMIWEVAADMLAFGRPNQVVTITITSNDDLDSIAQKLHDTGLIKYPGIFKFYGDLRNAEKKIKPGTYELNTIYDYMALVKNMAGTADRVSTKVVIPEGYTCAQIFRLLEKSGVCTVEAMEEAVTSADLSKYWFLEGIDQSNPNCLEGYLFPDTYEFYLDHDPSGVLKKLLDTFNKRLSESMVEKLDVLNENLADMMRRHGLSESYIQEHLFTMHDVVIVASMIEKETSGDEESYYIASVIYNRLTNPGEYPYLNIDASLVYITGRSPITQEDLKLDTPYNTYLYKGMIPGPISNPGLSSLNAALSPENTEYYYYALDPSTGSHKFFKTYKAHQNFLESLKKGD